MVENNFEEYIGLFIFYILPINYVIFIGQILNFWDKVQKKIVPIFYGDILDNTDFYGDSPCNIINRVS